MSGADFTAKDFRTWAVRVYALSELRKLNGASGREAKKGAIAIGKAVAERLGNTPAVCRKSYIHPELLDAHANSGLGLTRVNGHGDRRTNEVEFLNFLKRLKRGSQKPRKFWQHRSAHASGMKQN